MPNIFIKICCKYIDGSKCNFRPKILGLFRPSCECIWTGFGHACKDRVPNDRPNTPPPSLRGTDNEK